MTGIKDLFASERGVFAIALLIAATIFVVLGDMTIDQWTSFMQWIGGALILGKTVTTAVEMLTKPKQTEVPEARMVTPDK